MILARLFISLILLSPFLISCSEQNHEAHQQEIQHTDEHSITSNDTLTEMGLNNDQKWMMDKHTRTTFSEMATSFFTVDHAAMNNDGWKKVGTNLQTDIDTLIQECTMTEEAHDQLHIFLTGYIPAVTALAEKGQLEDAKEVAHYLNGYQRFFK